MKIRGNEESIGKLVAAVIRAFGCTLRITVEDRSRLLDRDY